MPTLSGVTLSYGNVVRIHRRDTGVVVGEVVSSAVDGTWSVDTTGVPGMCYGIEFGCADVAELGTAQGGLLNETAGATAFLDMYGVAMTTAGGVVSSATNPPPLTGISTSAYFDGAGDYLTLANQARVAPNGGDFLVEVFARPGPQTGDEYRPLFSIFNGTVLTYVRYGNSGFGRKLQAAMNEAGSISNVWSCSRTQTSDAGAWHLYAFERYNGACSLYFDGALQYVQNGANPSSYPYTAFNNTAVQTATTSISIGGDGWLGNVGPWRILNRAIRKTASYTVPTLPFSFTGGETDVNALILDRLTGG